MNEKTDEPDIVTTRKPGTRIAEFWCSIQSSLFPGLEEAIESPIERHGQLIYLLNFVGIERFVPSFSGLPGRPSTHRKLARAFLAKAFLNLPTTRDLISLLHGDAAFRRLVGFERRRDIPHESTFSRAFKRFSRRGLLDQVHEDHVKQALGEAIVFHVSRDATAVEARESAPRSVASKKEKGPKQKPGPKKGVPPRAKEQSRQERQFDQCWQESISELPTKCDIGVKKNSKGLLDYWRGYKLHVDVADGGIPLSVCTTSGSLHDSQAAIPLMRMTASRVGYVFYQLMDMGYPGKLIVEAAEALGQKAIVPQKAPNGGKAVPLDPATARRFKHRTVVERFNSELKDSYGGRHVRVRTQPKVHTHLMFGVLCIFAMAILRL
jgi:transposase